MFFLSMISVWPGRVGTPRGDVREKFRKDEFLVWDKSLKSKYVGVKYWFPGRLSGNSCNAGDIGDACSIPGLERSPGGGNDNPLQYSCLGNPMDREAWWDRGAWWDSVHGVAESDTTAHAHADADVNWKLVQTRGGQKKAKKAISMSRPLRQRSLMPPRICRPIPGGLLGHINKCTLRKGEISYGIPYI